VQPKQTADLFLELFNEGFRHHQAGRLKEAQTLYQQILTVQPHHAQSLHMMAMIGLSNRHYSIAEELVRLALAERNDIAGFYDTLGNILSAQEKFKEAVEAYEQALNLMPNAANCLNNLGAALVSLGKKDQALEVFKRALSIKPEHINSYNNAGVILQAQKKYEEAIEYYSKALALNPRDAVMQNNIGLAFMSLGKDEKAIEHFNKAIEFQADYKDPLLNLGHIYRTQEKLEEALKYYKRTLAIEPDADAHAKIGLILQNQGRLQESLVEYKQALELAPNSFEILNNLGTLHSDLTKFEEAITYFETALTIEPEEHGALSNIAGAYKNLGRLDKAIQFFQKALKAKPDDPYLYSNLLLAMIYADSVSPEDLAQVARQFGHEIADKMLRKRVFAHDMNLNRKIRIGYVSPDFCKHPVDYFVGYLFRHHDRKQFEIYAYSNTARHDAVTERIQHEVDHWRDIRFISDNSAADLIESDKIDILMDLAGHTGRNKLMIFALKPAPIQITWLGYPASTGMKAMDYRITDYYAEPAGMTEHLNTEKLWRLPKIFCCYQPHEKSPDVVDHCPFEDNSYITFGCFNNFSKVSDAALTAWGEILARVPNSKLLLEIKGIDHPNFRTETEARFIRLKLPMERVILEPRKNSNQFVLYNSIDIALDPFPCVGGTTSMDTLWMGVPFVTLGGKSFTQRMGVTILTNAGLPELITSNIDDYIKVAADLANDRERLKKLRHNLRERFTASPAMDQESFVRNMEAAYRGMWQKYCA